MKWLLLLTLIVGCSSFKIPKTVEEIPDVPYPTEEVPEEVIVQVPKPLVKVNVVSLKGFTATQEERFKKIATNVETILNSEEFKQAIINHEWQGKKQFVGTTDTNEQVIAKLLSKDWQLEYRLEYIAKIPFKALTVGYTYPDVSWIVINSKIFDSYADADIACNIAHEYGGHKLGRYDHAKSWSESRDYSTPYGIGYTLEKIYAEKFEQ